jgi:hypothetical protein
MMKRDFISRIISATLLGGLVGWSIHHNLITWNLRGREAFMVYEARRFDTNMATPSPVISNVIVAVLLALGSCVVYELIAYCISSAIKGSESEKKAD